LFPNGGSVLLELKKCFGNIRRWVIRERHIKRRSFGGGEIMKVLPTTGLSFVEAKCFEGVGRDEWSRLNGACLTV